MAHDFMGLRDTLKAVETIDDVLKLDPTKFNPKKMPSLPQNHSLFMIGGQSVKAYVIAIDTESQFQVSYQDAYVNGMVTDPYFYQVANSAIEQFYEILGQNPKVKIPNVFHLPPHE